MSVWLDSQTMLGIDFRMLGIDFRKLLQERLNKAIELAVDEDYNPMQHKWVTDGEGNQKKVEFAQRWWTASAVWETCDTSE